MSSISYDCPSDAANSKIWIDGCFDFAHHGHAGAMFQARRLGKELFVGVHSDEQILANKGPTVMRLDERMTAVEGCKWCTHAVADAPYTTDPAVMDQYDCKYVVHGDDITTNANGEDCYQIVKDQGRFIVVKRTPNISTTDLVGRMLLAQKIHHLPTITDADLKADNKVQIPHTILAADSHKRFTEYATDSTGKHLGSLVLIHTKEGNLKEFVNASKSTIETFNNGIYYIDGGFDLFNPGHIESLRKLKEMALQKNYGVLVGISDDAEINKYKGLNYPIMNLLERSLCVLQSKYIDGIVIGAPYIPSKSFIEKIEGFESFEVKKVFYGPNTDKEKVYNDVAELCENLGPHKYDSITTEVIVSRVLDNKKQYEERQRKKGWKSELEQKLKMQEINQ